MHKNCRCTFSAVTADATTEATAVTDFYFTVCNMIDQSNIILLKNIFWYLNKHPETAMISNVPVREEIFETVLSERPITLWIPVTPPSGKEQQLNVLEIKFPATPSEPLTVRGLLHYLYKHYNMTRIANKHINYIPDKVSDPSVIRYVDLMDKSILFMGLQYIKKYDIYNVMFAHSALL